RKIVGQRAVNFRQNAPNRICGETARCHIPQLPRVFFRVSGSMAKPLPPDLAGSIYFRSLKLFNGFFERFLGEVVMTQFLRDASPSMAGRPPVYQTFRKPFL